jgi:hypothetical protein
MGLVLHVCTQTEKLRNGLSRPKWLQAQADLVAGVAAII